MPSPFPGMDPYLEGSEWMSFHGQLVAEMARQLAPRLRPRYVARMEKRFVVEGPVADDGIAVGLVGEASTSLYPDVGIVDTGMAAPQGTATAGSSAPLLLATMMPEVIPQHSIEIRDVADRRLVTVIELLSPANKIGDGREQYLEKRSRLLLSHAHLMEIDLLRSGQRVPMTKPLPPSPYFVFLSRAGRRPLTEVWPIALGQSLPEIPVPLLRADPDIKLDLQAAFTNVYDGLGYDLALNYTRPPEVRLGAEESVWAKERLTNFPTKNAKQ